ncbi:mite group 2 allergen Pso o 2-like [Panonychus citri]|uniref:mite group 2 allergen Pso o 2-like n=1 Tax=Panonychus citri TaxID=50023 RepID=UPI0023078023|nr:mite group 2 allergen Pso o 2-like [Panonychus citri]
MFKSIAVLCLFLAVSSARQITTTKCGSAAGSVQNINVEPCDSDVCAFKPNMKVTITGELVPTVAAAAPTLSVQVEVSGFFVEYPGLSKNACDYLACPLKANEPNKFKIEVETLDWLPPMETDMQFHMYASDGGEELACAQARIAVTA